MNLSDIDYELPEKLIAQHPVEPRDSARLLVATSPDQVEHKHVTDLVDMLEAGDVMVVNDTRVLPARLSLHRKTGGAAEVLLLEQRSSDFRLWEALVKPASTLKPDEVLEYFGKRVVRVGPRTEAGDTFVVEILDENPMELLQRIGAMPLPPYIRSTLTDLERYQTVYARRMASAAAPTAGLHFSKIVMKKMELNGVQFSPITLHVGLGTFRQVDVEDLTKHKTDSEHFIIDETTCGFVNEALDNKKHVLAIGTTVMKALESSVSASGHLKPINSWTDKFIFPPYEFKIPTALLTNFHLPESILLMMTSAFGGYELVQEAYKQAIKEKYRFLTYGDAMLVI